MDFEKFPDKIIFEIFTHLDYDSFLNASAVCLQWNKIIEKHIDFFTSYFGGEDEDEGEEEPNSKKRKAVELEKDSLEEQRLVVQQINACKPNQYHEPVFIAILSILKSSHDFCFFLNIPSGSKSQSNL